MVRPQFFIPLITLLRNAATNALKYKAELALVKAQNIDVNRFEEQLESFKSGLRAIPTSRRGSLKSQSARSINQWITFKRPRTPYSNLPTTCGLRTRKLRTSRSKSLRVGTQ